MKNLFYLLLFFPALAYSQTSTHDSIWMPFNSFVGTWKGDGTSESGNGKYERSYQWIYNGTYIEIHNKSTYGPSANNPKGEVHEDLGYFSYDKVRKTFVLRQFHIEGFVNQYVLDSISPDSKTITFKTEAIENIPKGWQAKERYRILNKDVIEETFLLAQPGEDFTVYSKVTLHRQK